MMDIGQNNGMKRMITATNCANNDTIERSASTSSGADLVL
jgi:hypothetical protein